MNSRLLALAALIVASILVLGCTNQNQTNNQTGQVAAGSTEKIKVNFEITANGSTEKISASTDKGSNAFDVMKANLKVDYKTSAYGPFITGINGINSGSDNYWALYVDGVYAMKGIDQYTLDKDTSILWNLEKVQTGFS